MNIEYSMLIGDFMIEEKKTIRRKKPRLISTLARWNSELKYWSEAEKRDMEKLRVGVAYHEAGHAVFAWVLGNRIKKVSIGFLCEPGNENNGLFMGVCEYLCNTDTQNILVSLGGIRGEQVFRKRLSHDMHSTAKDDYTAVQEVLDALPNATDEETQKRLRYFTHVAKTIADRDDVRSAIVLVALALVETGKLYNDDVVTLCLKAGVVPIS